MDLGLSFHPTFPNLSHFPQFPIPSSLYQILQIFTKMLPLTILILLGCLYVIFDILSVNNSSFDTAKTIVRHVVYIHVILHIFVFLFKQVDAIIFIHNYAKQKNIEHLNTKIEIHDRLRASKTLRFYGNCTIANLPKIVDSEVSSN